MSIEEQMKSLWGTLMSSCSLGNFSHVYEHVCKIGKGTHGSVDAYKNKWNNKQVAVKTMRLDVPNNAKEIREVAVMKALRHRNIVEFINVYKHDGECKIVMEYLCDGIDLYNFLLSNMALQEDLAAYLFRQIADGILHMHQIGFAHCDIKPSNIYITKYGHIKIFDFGTSGKYGKRVSKYPVGTRLFIAPEVWRNQEYQTGPVDIWAMGVTLYYMTTKQYPFADPDLMFDVPHYKVHECWSIELTELIFRLLESNPQVRFTSTNVINHDWFVKAKAPAGILW